MVVHPAELDAAWAILLMRMPEMFTKTFWKLPTGGTPTNATETDAGVPVAVGDDPPPPPHPNGIKRPIRAIRGGSSEKTSHHGRRCFTRDPLKQEI